MSPVLDAWLNKLWEFLNNGSIAAFAGAFFAFVLVIWTDSRRERRKIKILRADVEKNLLHARSKLDTVRRNRGAITEYGKVIPAPIMKFDTGLIRNLASEVADRLTLDQRIAIDALCYQMEETDGVLQDAYDASRRGVEEQDEGKRHAIAIYITDVLSDAAVNLKRLDEMCQNYIDGDYKLIITKQYNRQEYEER